MTRRRKKTYGVASWRGSVPPFVDVTHELRPSDGDVAFVTLVRDERLEASRVRRVVQVNHPSVLTSTLINLFFGVTN